jgi:hypothetical protein
MTALLAMAVAILGLPAASASADSGTTLGTAVLKIGSQIAVTSSANPVSPSASVTLTATFALIAGNTDISPTGDVTFLDNGVALGTGALSGQTASWTGKLPSGAQSVTVDYAGDTDYTAGVSDPLPVTVGMVPVLAITLGGGSAALPSDGTWSSTIGVRATSDPGDNDFPHTRFSVAFAGTSGLSTGALALQEDTGGGWSDVTLTTAVPGQLTAAVGLDNDLSPGGSIGVNLRLRAPAGAPSGTVTMTTSLLGSPDGADWPDVLATAGQDFTVSAAPIATTTTVTASSVLTDGKNAAVRMTAKVSPSSAGGTITFLENGNVVSTSALHGGTATASPSLLLGSHAISATYSGDGTYATSTGSQPQQVTVSPPGGSLHAINPARLLDTRVGNGAPQLPIAPGKFLVLQVAGRGGVPAGGVAAVAVMVTVVSPPLAGSVTLYPTGGTVPATADVDFPVIPTTAGLAITQLSAAGQVSILNRSAAPINVIADVSAWFGQPTNSMDLQGRYNAIAPFRLLDTRKAPAKRMVAGSTVAIQVAGVSGLPATGITAVMLNVTSIKPSDIGYLVTYPGATPKPKTSTSQFQKNETRASRVIVGVGTDGKVDIFNSTLADTDIAVDIVGWFTTGQSTAGGMSYVPLPVSQRLSTTETGGPTWGSNSSREVPIAGVRGVPSLTSLIKASAVVANVHTVNSTGASYLTAYPTANRPVTSDLDFGVHQNLQNLTVAGLGPTGTFRLYNLVGNVTIPIDVAGWFG